MMYIKIMKRTQLYLSSRQHDELKIMALKQNSNVSELMRQLIDEKLNQASVPNTEPKPANAGSWLLAQANWAKEHAITGPADLATNLDGYLYGSK